MVAMYLDNDSVEKLHREYPGVKLGRLRKVVIQYNPSADQRSLYERHFGGSATVKVSKGMTHGCFLSPAALTPHVSRNTPSVQHCFDLVRRASPKVSRLLV